MRPFSFASEPSSGSKFLAGGTTLVDLMKLDVERPTTLINIDAGNDDLRRIEAGPQGVRIGALVKMADAATNPVIAREYPVVAQSLLLAASAQLRNMASLGGNVLQRTRCPYFRDVTYLACNKRDAGSGCAAKDGINRLHAVLGTSDQCVASYPGDFANALMALDAEIETSNRRILIADLHHNSDQPQQDHVLQEGELIRFIVIPKQDARRSLYLKIRDRDSYQFAVTSAAVVLDMDGQDARDVRIALGGVAYKPWRAREAEDILKGKPLTPQAMSQAAEAAFADARPLPHNAFKVDLGKRTIIRALTQAQALEV